MNKFLRFSVWLILIVGAIVITVALTQPRDITITRSVVIHAPADAVFSQVSDFTQWPSWSAMLRNDSTASVTYSGTAGQPGSAFKWVGDDGKIGSGSITNEGMEGTVMRYTFNVTSPGDMQADGTIAVRDSGLYSAVTWTFHKHFNFLANASLLVVNMDKYIGGDLESSLTNLKNYIEKQGGAIVAITETEHPGYTVAGVRDTVHSRDLITFFGDTYSLFLQTPQEKITGPHVGLYYQWDTLQNTADLMAGIVVTGTDIPVNGIIFSQVPKSRAYMAVHKGGYGSLAHAHNALRRYTTARGQSHWLAIEEYLQYPGNEPDSNKWVTNIYYLLQ